MSCELPPPPNYHELYTVIITPEIGVRETNPAHLFSNCRY